MVLAAVWDKDNVGFGCNPDSGAALTKAVSPAAGISSSALAGEVGAGLPQACSVLGTGINVDLTTNGFEAA